MSRRSNPAWTESIPSREPALTTSTVVIICGGRDLPPFTPPIVAWLDAMRAKLGIVEVVEGGGLGGDYHARSWAFQRGIRVVTFWANWEGEGKSAGPRRNERMGHYLSLRQVQHGMQIAVLALPGGRGTENMVQLAKASGIPVYRYEEEA